MDSSRCGNGWSWEVDSLSDGYKRKMGGAQVNLDSFQGTRAY